MEEGGQRGAVEKMKRWVGVSRWNFEAMSLLVKAELDYLNRDVRFAQASYEASNESVHAHKTLHYEKPWPMNYTVFSVLKMR